ncbi:MAG: TauD/TfdA family dioxygenase [Blastocatellia bacterium]
MSGTGDTKPTIDSLLSTRRKAIRMSGQEVVKTSRLLSEHAIPLLIEPGLEGADLVAWASSNRELVETLLWKNKALLFRNFAIRSVSQFKEFVLATSDGNLLEYRDRSSPRYEVADGVYISTIYPNDQEIHLHNEGTYWTTWPLKIYFCCLQVPDQGGETPIADVSNVYKSIDPKIRQQFIEKQVMYVRNYNDGFALPWQEVFQTTSKSEVESICRERQIEIQWKDNDRLRTRQIRQAVRLHPKTGEPVWFNHAAFFHLAAREQEVQEALSSMFSEGDLPFMTAYGDGSPIEQSVAESIQQAYRNEKVIFGWQQGDILLLDNMSVAHGRQPFVGERQVIVAMAEPCDDGVNS